MADDLGPAIRAERLAVIALIELLEHLDPAQWSTPSLCRGWTVQDVPAHVAWSPAAPIGEVLAGMAPAGFRPNKASADTARGWSRRGTAAILDQLRANAAGDAKPVGTPRVFALVDAVVHGLDIRRPLGIHRRVPPEAFRPAADLVARTGGRPRRCWAAASASGSAGCGWSPRTSTGRTDPGRRGTGRRTR